MQRSLAMRCTGVPDRTTAFIATTLLMDVVEANKENCSTIIDRQKYHQKRHKIGKDLQNSPASVRDELHILFLMGG